MTAEIAILNKSAVALAADSTVTIDSSDGRKTYNTVNKLFTLSKFQPIGSMIFGDANIMGVPWETVIKDYRSKLAGKSFPKVRDYLDDFVNFMGKSEYLRSQQGSQAWLASFRFFYRIVLAIQERAGPNTSIVDEKHDTTAIADELINDWQRRLAEAPLLPMVDEAFAESLVSTYDHQFREARDDAFKDKGIVLSDHAINLLPKIAARAIACGLIRADSGLVIAGFGEDQIFPSIVTITPFFVACDRFLYRINNGKSFDVGFDSDSALIPFAQQDVVTTFLDGIDPQYHELIESSISSLFEECSVSTQVAQRGR
jgi:hypothetical protein